MSRARGAAVDSGPTADDLDSSTVNFNDYENVPASFRQFITKQMWDSFSLCRKESISNAYTNPNAFFYRNRPPGDPQKFGKYSDAEIEQHIERVRYFRNELHLYDCHWGLFAVPLRGRLGYQCATVHRQLLKDGVINDPPTNRLPPIPNAVQLLEQEAIAFINEMCKVGQNNPTNAFSLGRGPKTIQKLEQNGVLRPSDRPPPKEKRKEKKTFSPPSPPASSPPPLRPTTPQRPIPSRQQQQQPQVAPIVDIKIPIKPKQMPPSPVVTRASTPKEEKPEVFIPIRPPSTTTFRSHLKFGQIPKEILLKSIHSAYQRRIRSENKGGVDETSFDVPDNNQDDETTCPILYAPDPITHMPMQFPMLDQHSGLVMDLTTWQKVFDKEVSIPEYYQASSVTDLVHLTRKSFRSFGESIQSIVC